MHSEIGPVDSLLSSQKFIHCSASVPFRQRSEIFERTSDNFLGYSVGHHGSEKLAIIGEFPIINGTDKYYQSFFPIIAMIV